MQKMVTRKSTSEKYQIIKRDANRGEEKSYDKEKSA